jgi:hypothetical protein
MSYSVHRPSLYMMLESLSSQKTGLWPYHDCFVNTYSFLVLSLPCRWVPGIIIVYWRSTLGHSILNCSGVTFDSHFSYDCPNFRTYQCCLDGNVQDNGFVEEVFIAVVMECCSLIVPSVRLPSNLSPGRLCRTIYPSVYIYPHPVLGLQLSPHPALQAHSFHYILHTCRHSSSLARV